MEKILGQRDFNGVNLIQVRIDLIEAVGDVRKHRFPGFAGKGHKGKVQDIVRPVGDKNVFRQNAIYLRQLLDERLAFRIGVEAKILQFCFSDGTHDLRRGRVGGFVGVQFDIGHIARLFAGRIDCKRLISSV